MKSLRCMRALRTHLVQGLKLSTLRLGGERNGTQSEPNADQTRYVDTVRRGPSPPQPRFGIEPAGQDPGRPRSAFRSALLAFASAISSLVCSISSRAFSQACAARSYCSSLSVWKRRP
jgi:hypothetical protein